MNLLDTDVVISLLRSRTYRMGAVSVVSLVEVLRGVDVGKRRRVKELLEESFEVVGLSNEVIEVYCDLYERLKGEGALVPDADLLIAATAMSKNLAVETGDEHFKRLVQFGLRLAEPSQKTE